MKKKYFKKDKKAKKSKSPKNVKKIVKAKKQARRFVVDGKNSTKLGIQQLRDANPDAEIITLGFTAEPEALADSGLDVQEPTADAPEVPA